MKNLALLILAITMLSCEKVLVEDLQSNNPVENFDALWKGVDEGYSFFEYKKINWDSLYDVYRPMIDEETSSEKLFSVLDDMLFHLQDGHVNLISPFNQSRNWEWYLDFPPNFDFDILQRNYWQDKQRYTGPLVNVIIDSVGYIRYSSFSSTVTDFDIDYVLAVFRAVEVKGVIIDVRDNGGGFTNNGFKIASRFTDERRHVYSRRIKNGPGHNDFSELNKAYVEPGGDNQWTDRVIVLTNRSSYSATNNFVAIMQALPNVTVIGDWTGGGGGTPAGDELPNGWKYRYSSTQTFTPEGFNIENGIPPDIRVDISQADKLRGRDTILDRALDEFR